MLTASHILEALDHSNDGYYCSFVALGHPYSYLLDSRLNLFQAEGQWAIVVERLGYSPRGGTIELELYYYGNCLVNLEEHNQRPTNIHRLSPSSWEAQQAILADDELLDPAATTLLVRATPVALTHDPAAYAQAGIELVEYEPGRISLEEVGRLLVRDHAALFRATDAELYKSLPGHLRKILVLDEWYHRDFNLASIPDISPSQMQEMYTLSGPGMRAAGMASDFTEFAASIQAQQERTRQQNHAEWAHNRPSSYETWPQLAEVLATGSLQHYRPTLAPTTHWRHWPESGAL